MANCRGCPHRDLCGDEGPNGACLLEDDSDRFYDGELLEGDEAMGMFMEDDPDPEDLNLITVDEGEDDD